MQAGDVIGGRFEVGRRIGEGGMGAVYRALDRQTGQTVALKVLHDLIETSAHGVARFLREAETLATLSHPAIVAHVAHGTGDAPWLAMAWVQGETLADRIGRGALALEDVVALGRALAGALAFAHAAGVLHRDLKPSNVILADGDVRRPVVVDFGLARKDGMAQRVTRTGMTMGTPGYMAPEQARGAPDIDARADVFSLGALLYECLTGRPAFEGMHPMAVIARLLLEDAPRVSTSRHEVPRALDALIAAMLEREVPRRTASMTQVADALAALEASGELSGPGPRPSLVTFAESRIVTVAAFTAPSAAGEADTIVGVTGRTEPSVAQGDEPERLVALAGGLWMALFEGDGSPADQVERALRFALDRTRTGGRAFVATGRAATGATPTGQAIERVVRGITEPGEPGVAVDELTARLGAERFTATERGHHFVITGESRRPRTGLTSSPLESAFVGRERELGLIVSTVAAASTDHAAHAIVITAAPGHGKSRLVRAVLARLSDPQVRDEGDEPPRILYGRAERVGAGGAFSLLGDLVRDAASLHAETTTEGRSSKLAQMVKRVLSNDERVAALLGELVDARSTLTDHPWLAALRADPVLLGDRMRDAVIEWLRAESQRTTVLILEDLHWGDLPTVRLVDTALRELADRPLVVVALGRPEVSERFPSLFSDRPRTELSLPPLPKRAAEKLVRAGLPGADEALVERIVARAAGSPLFLEELVRAVDRGETALPETVASVIEARLSGLSPEARRTLRAASVFGLRFRDADVARLLERDATLGPGIFVELQGAELLGSHTESLEHSFKSELLRDAAYATLPEIDREHAHRLVGEMLEVRGEDAQRIAHHHELGKQPLRAAHAWLAAARDALAGDDLDGAIERAARGLVAGAGLDPQIVGALYLTQTVAHRWRLRPAEAAVTAAEAMALFTVGSASYFEAMGERVLAAARVGDHASIQGFLELARRTPTEDDAAAVPRALVLVNAAASYALIGDVGGAQSILAETARWLGGPPEDDTRLAGRVNLTRGLMAAIRGELGTSRTAHGRAAAHFRNIGDERSALSATINAALVDLRLGMVHEAIGALTDAATQAERRSLTFILQFARSNLGHALMRAGELGLAAEALDGILNHAPSANTRLGASAGIDRATVHLLCDERELALACAEQAVARSKPFPPMHANARAVRAEILLRSGHLDEALSEAERAEAIRVELGGLEEGEVLLALTLADALRLSGQTERSRQVLSDARARLLSRAQRIADETLARSFLHNVAEHRRLMRETEEL